MKLEGIWYILFYTMLLVIGLILVSRPMKNNTSDDINKIDFNLFNIQ